MHPDTVLAAIAHYRQVEIIRELKAGGGAVDLGEKQMLEQIYKAVIKRGAI